MSAAPIRLVAAVLMLLAGPGPAMAQQFALQTGPPVAAMPDPTKKDQKKFKDAWFVVRSQGCADVSTFHLEARVEGQVSGTRRTDTVTAVPAPQAGVFAILNPGRPGTWVVVLSGTCGTAHAGAIVSMAGGQYRREGVGLLPHHPTPEEVEQALARAMGGGRD